MTNAEKYLKDRVSRQFLTDFKRWYYSKVRVLTNADTVLADFLAEKAKSTLTEDERVILRNIDKNRYQIIERDEETLWIHGADKDGFGCTEEFMCYEHLFQFIKKRRRIRNKGITRR